LCRKSALNPPKNELSWSGMLDAEEVNPFFASFSTRPPATVDITSPRIGIKCAFRPSLNSIFTAGISLRVQDAAEISHVVRVHCHITTGIRRARSQARHIIPQTATYQPSSSVLGVCRRSAGRLGQARCPKKTPVPQNYLSTAEQRLLRPPGPKAGALDEWVTITRLWPALFSNR